jgi:hypothetical protein
LLNISQEEITIKKHKGSLILFWSHDDRKLLGMWRWTTQVKMITECG